MNLLDGSKFLAVTAFVVAFPPIFTSVGRGEGLKLSLALLLLYLIRGTFQLFIDTCYGDGRDKGSRQKDKPTSHQIKETIAFLKQSVWSPRIRPTSLFRVESLCLVRSPPYCWLATWVSSTFPVGAVQFMNVYYGGPALR